MSDVLVSVRMPKSLLEKLKGYSKKNDYMDVSETVRSIMRKQWLKYMQPEILEIQKLRKGILDEIRKKSEREISKRVVKEFNEIKKNLRKYEK